MHLRDAIAKVTATDHYGDRLSIEVPTTRQRLLMWTRQDSDTDGPAGGYYVFGPKDAGRIRELRDALTQWLDLQDTPTICPSASHGCSPTTFGRMGRNQ